MNKVMSLGIFLRRILWCFMNLASSLFIASLYLIKSKFIFTFTQINSVDIIISFAIFICTPIMLSIIGLKLFEKSCPKDSLNSNVQKVSSANKDYLPVYLGYFFVSLSIPGEANSIEWEILSIFVIIIWIFTALTTTYYFNPLLLLLGYKFYNVVSHNGIEIFIISRRAIGKNEQNVVFPHLRKITEYVYIEEK